jgi:hypothetical protein
MQNNTLSTFSAPYSVRYYQGLHMTASAFSDMSLHASPSLKQNDYNRGLPTGELLSLNDRSTAPRCETL